MYKLDDYEFAYLISFWLGWVFDKKYLAEVCQETLDKLVDEFNNYELEMHTKVDTETMKLAWQYYFSNNDLITDDIMDALDDLE